MLNVNEKNLFMENKGCFPPEKPRYTMTEEIHHTARRMEEVIDRLLKFEERLKNDFASLSSHLTSDNVLFKDTVNTAYLSFLQEVKNEVNLFEGNVENTMSLFQKDIETNYATLSEDVKKQINDNLEAFETMVDEFETKYEEEFVALKSAIQEQYNAFAENINSRIDSNNTTFSQAFTDYQQKVTTEINTFQASVNNNYATFVESVNNTVQVFKETWIAIIEERLNNQDSKISDNEMYMKTNLVGTVTALIGDMHTNGDFVSIIEGEVFNHLESRIENVESKFTTPQLFGAVADGETDDTTAFEEMFATSKNVYIPNGKYLISKSLDCRGVNIEGEKDTFIYFTNEAENGLIVGNATVKNINLVMMNNFSGSLMRVDEGIVNAYPEKTIVENVCLYSLNEEYVGTFLHIRPFDNYGSIFEKIKIGRMNETITSQSNRAETGIFVEVAENWGNGYTFRDIIIDGYIKNPVKIVSNNYNNCTNFIFENVQIQEKNNSEGFKHNYLAYFEGVKDFYLINCKVWDYSKDYVIERVIYKNTSNIIIRNSPVFEKYFDNKMMGKKNPFTIQGEEIGYKENRKLYNSKFSENNGYTGMCETLTISSDYTDRAIPYFIPFSFNEFLYSKFVLELWSRLNYGTGSGDNYLRLELMQTSYINNVILLNKYTNTLPSILKIKKYQEGIVVWIKCGIGEVYYNCESGGKPVEALGTMFTNLDGSTEVVNLIETSNGFIPECKTLSVISATVLDSTTTV